MATKQRREFIKKLGLGALALSSGPFTNAIAADQTNGTSAIPTDGFTVLFQGDSITDGNRTRNQDWNHVMGHGYQFIIASKLWYEHPAKGLHFFNRGISGNKVTDLSARWQKDTLDLKPNLLSILVGINDVSAFINGDTNFSAEQYETGYRSVLQQAREALPGIELVLCEPFIGRVGKIADKWDTYSAEVKKRSDIVKRLSAEFNTVFVPFQTAFDKALSKAPAEYWIWDGVHPMPAGHELMAREWMRSVGKKFRFMKY